MRLLRTLFGAILLLVLSLSPALAQPASSIQLATVKYDGLADAVKKHRGKVVYVDFWSVY
ncbi:MAG: hypothetical protein K2X38_14235 [Gemmataceae bacterium]|nr:hypothetical protein [Gemmataceae bacterium]